MRVISFFVVMAGWMVLILIQALVWSYPGPDPQDNDQDVPDSICTSKFNRIARLGNGPASIFNIFAGESDRTISHETRMAQAGKGDLPAQECPGEDTDPRVWLFLHPGERESQR